MKSTSMIALVVAGAAALTACSLVPEAVAQSTSRTLMIPLTGAAEGPGLGDPDGSGMAELMIDPVRGRFCYVLTVEGIAPAQLAHIHRSPAGEAGGPIVVQLEAPTDGESEDCMAIAPEIARSLLENPAAYYVNVHNPEHPGGAVRGQLDSG
ncbi:MAG: CHRD domain-containing protein [Pseudomonadota bacterium]|nr:CHRD domain-containing protein [Pseudomonadota bacterium]